jgi:hypothetical protein
VETLTSWDQEVQDLLVQQAEVRVGFFRIKEKHQLDPELLGSPCCDRRHLPPVALLDTSLDEEPILPMTERWTELLDDSEAHCGVENDVIRYLPEPDGLGELTVRRTGTRGYSGARGAG